MLANPIASHHQRSHKAKPAFSHYGGYNDAGLPFPSLFPSRTEFSLTILRQTTVLRNEPLLAYLIGSLGLKRRTSKNLLKFVWASDL